jgi:DNA-binding NtrC family response regulator
MKILIIDDDADDREIFCEIVLSLQPDAACLGFEDAEKALAYLRAPQAQVDYIFVDVMMTPMVGKECLIEIKGIAGMKDVPVIMYSGTSNVHGVAEYKNLGAARFIVKPIRIDQLREILASIIQ